MRNSVNFILYLLSAVRECGRRHLSICLCASHGHVRSCGFGSLPRLVSSRIVSRYGADMCTQGESEY